MKFDIFLTLRLALAGTFIGHGFFAFTQKPAWIPYLMTVGFNQGTTLVLMQIIGVIDFGVAAMAIFYPNKWVFGYALFWTLATATIRPISGEHIMELVERSSNIAVPLALLIIQKKNAPKMRHFKLG